MNFMSWEYIHSSSYLYSFTPVQTLLQQRVHTNGSYSNYTKSVLLYYFDISAYKTVMSSCSTLASMTYEVAKMTTYCNIYLYVRPV